MAEREGRPSPEALLAAAKQEGRGRLKIFLGAAPGVGKSYEMLRSAQAKRRDGVDVVVGVVESHGRRETEALLEGLEVIPRRQVEYKGHLLAEMDLDAILKRRPQLVIVDELAHTNDVVEALDVLNVEGCEDIDARGDQLLDVEIALGMPAAGVLDQADDI